MANEAHLARLRQGVQAWNMWRSAHPEIRPNLNTADLFQALLVGPNLTGGDLTGANLMEAALSGADLRKAQLGVANLF
jgi:uncharacterized protein YjbI with pentapeptide repeats